MKRLLALLILTAASASAQEFRARVSEVHNGNTISVHETGRRGTEVVRLAGIAVPGRWRPFAAKSRESLRELVKYKQVTIIVRSSDRYGRMTATVLLDDLDVGLEQIRRGMAWCEPEGSAIPAYEAAEVEAERQGVGLWAQRR
ncbi:MAG TPA: thermonuclease family protein [Thermoanaerobaculia bacterium]|nr:thermonuclease family protein [Thermoanaerobaculia bacterium]